MKKISCIFLNPQFRYHHHHKRTRLNGTAPNKRQFILQQHHMNMWWGSTISDAEYAQIQALEGTNHSPIEHIQLENDYRVERLYRHKHMFDDFFYYAKSSNLSQVHSCEYHGEITAVDRKNCYANLALNLKYPHPHYLLRVEPSHALFSTFLTSDIESLLCVTITKKDIYRDILRTMHPFKTMANKYFQGFLWEDDVQLTALINKKQYNVYQQYMDIQVQWIISSQQHVAHPLHAVIERNMIIRAQALKGSIVDKWSKIKILLAVNYGTKNQFRYLPAQDIKYHLQQQHVFAIKPHKRHFSLSSNKKKYRIGHLNNNNMYMWSTLIEMSASAELFQEMMNIRLLGGYIHYVNIDSIHYSCPTPIQWNNQWKLEHLAHEGVWFDTGKWILFSKNGMNAVGFINHEYKKPVQKIYYRGTLLTWNYFNINTRYNTELVNTHVKRTWWPYERLCEEYKCLDNRYNAIHRYQYYINKTP